MLDFIEVNSLTPYTGLIQNSRTADFLGSAMWNKKMIQTKVIDFFMVNSTVTLDVILTLMLKVIPRSILKFLLKVT